MTFDDLLPIIENASYPPVVPSRPLVLLTDALGKFNALTNEDNLSQEALDVLDAAESVAFNWSFYPPEEFGSAMASVDFEMIIELQRRVEIYRAETNNPPLDALRRGWRSEDE